MLREGDSAIYILTTFVCRSTWDIRGAICHIYSRSRRNGDDNRIGGENKKEKDETGMHIYMYKARRGHIWSTRLEINISSPDEKKAINDVKEDAEEAMQ